MRVVYAAVVAVVVAEDETVSFLKQETAGLQIVSLLGEVVALQRVF